MRGFDFGQIGEIVSNVMDSDYIDIKRNIAGSLVEVYSNIPCHIAYVSIDNPNPETVDIKPIIQGLRIHLPLWVDIRNDDFIVAKKIDSNGNIAGVYSGRCGNQVVSQGRKKVLMEMSATEPEEPTPPPPGEYFDIYISYNEISLNAIESCPILDNETLEDGISFMTDFYTYLSTDDEKIRMDSVENVGKGETFTMEAPVIDDYDFAYCVLDGIRIEQSTIVIGNVQANHEIKFVYRKSTVLDDFAFLVNGLYTRDDGRLANGWHTYKSVPMDSLSYDNGVYTITSDNVVFEHRDNGKILSIKSGARIVLFPDDVFALIGNVNVSGEKATFTATPFIPSEEQANFYKTRWYDNEHKE